MAFLLAVIYYRQDLTFITHNLARDMPVMVAVGSEIVVLIGR
jgi:hypothetical protein